LEKDSIDVIFSISVFIHFNLYDIYCYFKEFCRVLKPGGRIYVDIADSDRLDFDYPGRYETYFLRHSEYYEKNPEGLSGLMQWNSLVSVVRMASHFGFQNTFKGSDEDSCLVFVKNIKGSLEATVR
jgi:ubiquinone/menaquinone biosynthesis C-methylase UbiE